jgi:hypothetical protein
MQGNKSSRVCLSEADPIRHVLGEADGVYILLTYFHFLADSLVFWCCLKNDLMKHKKEVLQGEF